MNDKEIKAAMEELVRVIPTVGLTQEQYEKELSAFLEKQWTPVIYSAMRRNQALRNTLFRFHKFEFPNNNRVLMAVYPRVLEAVRRKFKEPWGKEGRLVIKDASPLHPRNIGPVHYAIVPDLNLTPSVPVISRRTHTLGRAKERPEMSILSQVAQPDLDATPTPRIERARSYYQNALEYGYFVCYNFFDPEFHMTVEPRYYDVAYADFEKKYLERRVYSILKPKLEEYFENTSDRLKRILKSLPDNFVVRVSPDRAGWLYEAVSHASTQIFHEIRDDLPARIEPLEFFNARKVFEQSRMVRAWITTIQIPILIENLTVVEKHTSDLSLYFSKLVSDCQFGNTVLVSTEMPADVPRMLGKFAEHSAMIWKYLSFLIYQIQPFADKSLAEWTETVHAFVMSHPLSEDEINDTIMRVAVFFLQMEPRGSKMNRSHIVSAFQLLHLPENQIETFVKTKRVRLPKLEFSCASRIHALMR